MGIHDGHRDRMKERFLRHGLENFDDINTLELLLFFALPRRETNSIAHALLQRFGSLSGVLEAGAEELQKVDGIGENAAVLLTLIPSLSRRYMTHKQPSDLPLDTPAAAARYFIPRFMYETEEVVFAALLDARKQPLLCCEVGRGVIDAAEINSRRLAELCLTHRASAVILAHNHVSGVVAPSSEDELSTVRLGRALAVLGLELCDHIIIAGCEYFSMRESGLLRF